MVLLQLAPLGFFKVVPMSVPGRAPGTTNYYNYNSLLPGGLLAQARWTNVPTEVTPKWLPVCKCLFEWFYFNWHLWDFLGLVPLWSLAGCLAQLMIIIRNWLLPGGLLAQAWWTNVPTEVPPRRFPECNRLFEWFYFNWSLWIF